MRKTELVMKPLNRLAGVAGFFVALLLAGCGASGPLPGPPDFSIPSWTLKGRK